MSSFDELNQNTAAAEKTRNQRLDAIYHLYQDDIVTRLRQYSKIHTDKEMDININDIKVTEFDFYGSEYQQLCIRLKAYFKSQQCHVTLEMKPEKDRYWLSINWSSDDQD